MLVFQRAVVQCPRVLSRSLPRQVVSRNFCDDGGNTKRPKEPSFVRRKEEEKSSFVKQYDENKEIFKLLSAKELKDGFKAALTTTSAEQIPKETDILIIGGGIIGSSIAYWIKNRAPGSFHVTVVDRDPTYQRCATTRSAGGVRQQFSLKENCQMAMFGAQFLRDYKHYLGEDAPDPQFNPEGYLFLADTDEKAALMEQNARMQRQCGARVELLSEEMMRRRFPFIATDDIKLASYGLQNEGWFDPWSLLQGLKQFNLRHQTGYVNGEVVDFRFRSEHCFRGPEQIYEPTNHVIVRLPNGELKEIIFSVIVLAAGPHTGDLGRLLRIGTRPGIREVPIPIEPRKRSIYTFHSPEVPIVGFPFLIDPSGAYCRREGLGGHFICGRSPDPEDDGPCDEDLENVDESYFNEVIWPTLARRVPAFNNIKLGHSWCGFYDYNYLDENAIIGHHPYYHHCIICSGFSGHGLQMAPAAGRAVMELITETEFVSIDLTRFSFDRVLRGEAICEQGIV